MTRLVVCDTRRFDGVSDRPLEHASVVVEPGRIREVVVSASPESGDARVVDGGGGTLLPGSSTCTPTSSPIWAPGSASRTA